ncbi:hypothetical protein GCM10020255_083980 [Rhodococcus baikonurensis]
MNAEPTESESPQLDQMIEPADDAVESEDSASTSSSTTISSTQYWSRFCSSWIRQPKSASSHPSPAPRRNESKNA